MATDSSFTALVQFSKNRLIHRFATVSIAVRQIEVIVDEFGINFTKYLGCRLTYGDSLRRGVIDSTPLCKFWKMQGLFKGKIIQKGFTNIQYIIPL